MVNHNELAKLSCKLQPLPTSTMRLAAIAAQEVPDIDEAIDVVSFDPILTARLLRMANSAVFGFRRRIGTVREAVIHLGTGIVMGAAIGHSAKKVMGGAIPGYGLAAGELWRHSVGAALATEVIRSHTKAGATDYAFTAALLHDIGKPILGTLMTPDLARLCERAREEGGREPADAEMEILAAHHAEVGGIVAQHWSIPDAIVEAITYHHSPSWRHHSDAHVVNVADIVAHQVEGHPVEPLKNQAGFVVATERLKLTDSSMEAFAAITAEKLAVMAEFLG